MLTYTRKVLGIVWDDIKGMPSLVSLIVATAVTGLVVFNCVGGGFSALGATPVAAADGASIEEMTDIVEPCSGDVLLSMGHSGAEFGDQTIGFEHVIADEPKTTMVKPGKIKKKVRHGNPGEPIVIRVLDGVLMSSAVAPACTEYFGAVRVTQKNKVKVTFINRTSSPHLFGGRLITKQGEAVRLPTKLVYPGKTAKFGFGGLTLKRGEAVVTELIDGTVDLDAATAR
jgi:hypothetical protein